MVCNFINKGKKSILQVKKKVWLTGHSSHMHCHRIVYVLTAVVTTVSPREGVLQACQDKPALFVVGYDMGDIMALP